MTSAEQTKSIVIHEGPIICKLAVQGQKIRQVIELDYLGTRISSAGRIEEEVRLQENKINRVADCLNDTVWRNRHFSKETTSREYSVVQ